MASATILPGAPTFSRREIRPRKTPTPSLFSSVPNPGTPGREPSLFPWQPGSAERKGMARLAASSPCVQEKRGAEYFLLPAKSLLNRCASRRVPFPWTINPYRGCEFGCQYCYARYTHEYMELDGSVFDHKIYVKQNAAQVLAQDIRRHLDGLTSGVQPEHIAIGTATDPYQPAEREFGVTRAILETLAGESGLSLSITTKSTLILRDLELLARIAARSVLSINMTVTTLRPRLARLLEPRAPRPDLRLHAVRKLREAGLAAGVFAMPVLPGLTDDEEGLEALARAASQAGAQWLGAAVLFLMPASLKQFLPFLTAKFPRLARRYCALYGRGAYAPADYQEQIAGRIARLRAKYGLASRPYLPDAAPRATTAQPALPLRMGTEACPELVQLTAPLRPSNGSLAAGRGEA